MPFEQAGLSFAPDAQVVVFDPTQILRLADHEPLHVTGFRPDHDRIVQAGGKVALAAPPSAAALVIVCLPRDRAQGLARIAEGFAALAPEGWLLIDGQKTDGVDATLKRLRSVIPMAGIASKSHGKIAWVQQPTTLPDALADCQAAAAPSPNPQGYITAPGMFSAGGLDPASALLIEHLPRDAKGMAADLGAGWGPLSAALLAANPEITTADLVEADHSTLQAARQNIHDTRARFHWADVTAWGGGPYDVIVSNPPFHVSRSADPALGQAFIQAAANLLRPKGRLYIVANRQLPYEASFEAAFHSWSQVVSTSHYKILTATRPRTHRRAA